MGFASSSCHVVDRVIKLPTVRHVWLRGRSMPSQWPSNGFNGSMLSMGSSSLTWCLPTMGGDAWWRIHKIMYLIFAKGFHQWRYPKIDGLQWTILLKWMIWGYPYFRKPPYIIEIALNIYTHKYISYVSLSGCDRNSPFFRNQINPRLPATAHENALGSFTRSVGSVALENSHMLTSYIPYANHGAGIFTYIYQHLPEITQM